jgi:hypothetical protein
LLNAAGAILLDLSHHVELTHSPHTEVFEDCPWNSVSQTARLLRIAYAVTERRILTARRWASVERVHFSCRLHPARDAF